MNKSVQYITHLGDLHCRNYSRKEEYYDCFKRFLKKQRELKPDRIIITGDITHQKSYMSGDLIKMMSWFFKECLDICPLIIINGNHDSVLYVKDRLDNVSPIVQSLDKKDIWHFTESGNYVDNYDENIVYCVWSCLDNQKDPQLNKYKEKYDKENKKTYITLFHGQVKGCLSDQNFKFSEGFDINNFKNSSICMLGDIHKRQSFEIKNDDNSICPILYCGSLICQNYSESNNKGFIFWDVKKRTYQFHSVENDYGFYTIELNGFDNLNNNPNEKNLKISKKPNIRVIWKDNSNNYSSIRQNEIKEYYQNKYNPISLTVNFDSVDSNELMNIDKDSSDNISNPEIQKKLILEFLIENNQIDDEELEIEIDGELLKEKEHDGKLKPVCFDTL